MKRLIYVCLFNLVFCWPRPSKGGEEAKNAVTLGLNPVLSHPPSAGWQATFATSIPVLSLEIADGRNLTAAFSGKIQTVGRWAREGRLHGILDVNYKLQPELRFGVCQLGDAAIQSMVFFNHWSFHKIDSHQGVTPQLNMLGLEVRLFTHSATASAVATPISGYVFAQGQMNINNAKVTYHRPLVLGGRLDYAVAEDELWLYTEHLVEAGWPVFYKGEVGLKIALTEPLKLTPVEVFVSWTNGQDGVSAIFGGIPPYMQGFEAGLRVLW